MRNLPVLLILCACCLLAGCGGNAPQSLPSILTADPIGSWLEIPVNSDASTALPSTSLLTLASDGTFRFEDSTPANWVAGHYQKATGHLLFTRESSGGTGAFFAQDDVTFLFTDTQTLLLTTTAAGGTVQRRYCRLLDTPPSDVHGEWLLAERYSSTNAQLPCLQSVQWNATATGELSLISYDMVAQQFTSGRGRLLVTGNGWLAARLTEGDGRLYTLGAYQVSHNTLIFTMADGTRNYCAARLPLDTRLINRWQGEDAAVLNLQSDGAYTLSAGTATSGHWSIYYGGYLCLSGATDQHTLQWNLYTQSDTPRLQLGEWRADVPQTTYFHESDWWRVDGTSAVRP